ncbi:MAG: NADP-dependent phosphogluconate dehydrogenase [Deltaproteobacteria bacterium]|nr:NADP-dependent phosphogluconate dehydrogenase [Deltaproteobacteria bacterium]
MSDKASFGLVGLGVMGANLAENVEEKGFSVAVYNRTKSRTDEFMGQIGAKRFVAAYSPAELAEKLERPRRILIMVKAGDAVDSTIESLVPHLAPGDVIIDGGNEWYENTERRSASLAARGFHFVGMGVSGGEEGARHGPSLMPGGPKEAYGHIEGILRKIAAQVDDGPCVTHIGPGGAGHYVKMVHNGIEYGDMQLIAEVYDLLRHGGGLSTDQLADVFDEWNRGELESFLVEITAKVFRKKDEGSDRPLLDAVLDYAKMKGTGSWTVEDSARLGVPIPTIASAVDARLMSTMRPLRLVAETKLVGPRPAPKKADHDEIVADARAALYAAKAVSYAQGIALLNQASSNRNWGLAIGEIARIWKGGCIIRAAFLRRIQEAYGRDGGLQHLLFDHEFIVELGARQEGWRRTVKRAIDAGISVPTMSASLAYYDALRRGRLPANLTQAQRDFFGAHTYQRVDREGTFHSDWG